MSARLRAVDSDGQVHEDACPRCQQTLDENEGLKRDLGRALGRERALLRDREQEARVHPERAAIVHVFETWQERCRHPNTKLDAERTFQIAEMVKRYGMEMCLVAIEGAAFDPFTTTQKNGSVKRHDGIGLIFRNAEKFEDFCCRAPVDKRREILATVEDVDSDPQAGPQADSGDVQADPPDQQGLLLLEEDQQREAS